MPFLDVVCRFDHQSEDGVSNNRTALCSWWGGFNHDRLSLNMNLSPSDYSTPQEGFAPRQTFGHGPSGIDVLSKLTDVRIFQLKLDQTLSDNFVNFPPNLLSILLTDNNQGSQRRRVQLQQVWAVRRDIAALVHVAAGELKLLMVLSWSSLHYI